VNAQHHPPSRRESRAQDFIWYVAISLAMMLFAVVLGISHVSLEAAGRVLSLVLFTGILYGAFIAFNRALFRISAFWLLTITLLSAHVVVFVIINTRVEHWRGTWNGVMFVEAPILDLLKGKFVHPRRTRASR
jgi:hypothetical protein